MKSKLFLVFIVIAPLISGMSEPRSQEVDWVPASASVHVERNIDYYRDSLCAIYGVPKELVREIGQNESNWLHPEDTSYIRMCGIEGEDSRGDLQINMKYWEMFSRRYEIQHPNRIGLLQAGIAHLANLRARYGSWKKARFAYGRGHWRNESTWTALEKKFMTKINWNQYDNN